MVNLNQLITGGVQLVDTWKLRLLDHISQRIRLTNVWSAPGHESYETWTSTLEVTSGDIR